MSERIHYEDNNNVRHVMRVGRFWAYFYQEWSGSSRRQIKINEVVWFNPFTWFTKSYWRTDGIELGFNMQFFRGDGQEILPQTLNPSFNDYNGFRHIKLIYASIGFTSGSSRPGTANIDRLGNDARDVASVRLSYEFDGETYVLV